ncbi:potassium transporter TrkA [Mycobacterium rhizamassiliense]|uniref:Potassium transporter TrkA n=1 Tax=Mycobacterium rhizamassiliense TaxID=1841860 RepID=A0A2U3NMD1_9MYCO|nr:NAD-binding protein [Mycobacterium rhizamassiliense]SPM32672.1 potassium transporter TrkA [Mycobacterium rhizamassiliense]
MHQCVIVSGDDALATTIIEELKRAGASVARLLDAELAGARVKTELARAGVAHASAIVCAGVDDATNLEIALLARKANPDIRVVARLANDVLREAVAADDGPSAILGVADLAAPAVVEACLARTTHPFDAAGMRFVVFGAEAPYDATLREIYGDLAPVAVVDGEGSVNPGEVVACPGRDMRVNAGDWTAMIGTTEEVAECGIKAPRRAGTRSRQSKLRRVIYAARALSNEVNPAFYPVMGALAILIIGSTALLHYSYTHPGMSWVDAFYFTNETITTTGYGDFSFAKQPTWLRIYAAMLMLGGVTTTALLVAFVADVMLSRRFVWSSGRPRARHLRNHIIVVGLSALGIRVVNDLIAEGYDVAVIERDQGNPFLSTMSELDVPVIFGDATLRQTLEAARVETARAVAVLTRDDMVNIETGIVLREMLASQESATGNRWSEVPLVLRVYDHDLGSAVAQRFGFENVRSTVELAAPWFIGAAMGLQVLGTFSVGSRSFMVGGMHVQAGSELDGLQMFEVSTQARVIAITRDDAPVRLHPRRDARLSAGDTVYLVGPYRELLASLRKGQPSSEYAEQEVNARGIA